MASEITLHMDYEWVKEPTSLCKCTFCQDVIYSQTNVLYGFLTVENSPLPIGTFKIMEYCNSCQEALSL